MENLFRGKRVDNGEWVYGCLLFIEDKSFIICEAEMSCIDGENTDLYATEWYEVDPFTVCRYTGLTDKNGRKIFEGDIIERTDLHIAKEPSVGFIEYDTDNTSFLIHWTDIANYSPTFPWKDRIEIVGNVFDNPERIGW